MNEKVQAFSLEYVVSSLILSAFFGGALFSESIIIELLCLVASRMKGTCLMILLPCCTYSSCIQSHLIHNNPGCFTHICASVLYAVHTVLLSVFPLKCLSKMHDWSLSKHIAGVMLVVHLNLAYRLWPVGLLNNTTNKWTRVLCTMANRENKKKKGARSSLIVQVDSLL